MKLVLGLVLAILTLAIAIPSAKSESGLSTYQNKDFHFKIGYPSNWTKQERAYLIVAYLHNPNTWPVCIGIFERVR